MTAYGGIGGREYDFPLNLTLVRRILAGVTETSDGCWVWQRATSGSGYARISVGGGLYMAHRVLYAMLVGPLDPALDLDHLCRQRLCVNPHHLDPVTRAVNLRRGADWKRRTSAGAAFRGEAVASPADVTSVEASA